MSSSPFQQIVKNIASTSTSIQNEQVAGIEALYKKYRDGILNLDKTIEEVLNQHYVAFKNNKNIVGIVVRKTSIKIYVNAKYGTLNDSRNLAKDVSKVGHLASGDYLFQVSSDKDFDYILSLIKQNI